MDWEIEDTTPNLGIFLKRVEVLDRCLQEYEGFNDRTFHITLVADYPIVTLDPVVQVSATKVQTRKYTERLRSAIERSAQIMNLDSRWLNNDFTKSPMYHDKVHQDRKYVKSYRTISVFTATYKVTLCAKLIELDLLVGNKQELLQLVSTFWRIGRYINHREFFKWYCEFYEPVELPLRDNSREFLEELEELSRNRRKH